MCTDIDCFPHLMTIADKDLILSEDFNRRNSWTTSSSSSSSTTTIPTTTDDSTTWIERKLSFYFKRFFRRNSLPSKSNSSISDRRSSSIVEEVLTITPIEQMKQSVEEEENKDQENHLSSSSSSVTLKEESSIIKNSNSTDLLYDYDHLLARCLARQELDRTKMMSRCQTPVTIPHADLIVGHSRTRVVNWKTYLRLFRVLNRDPKLFQQYINQYFACQSSVNQREQLTFNARTTKSTFDNLLKLFLNEYVTCLACQKAETHLIKSSSLWLIECQLCGSQRSVKRLKWKISK